MDERAHKLCLEGVRLLSSWSCAVLHDYAWRSLRFGGSALSGSGLHVATDSTQPDSR